jgi:hypothetical protein
MRLRDVREQGFDGFRACAAEHAWRPLTFPLAPFLSPTGRGRGECGGLEGKNVGNLSSIRYFLKGGKHGGLERKNAGNPLTS